MGFSINCLRKSNWPVMNVKPMTDTKANGLNLPPTLNDMKKRITLGVLDVRWHRRLVQNRYETGGVQSGGESPRANDLRLRGGDKNLCCEGEITIIITLN